MKKNPYQCQISLSIVIEWPTIPEQQSFCVCIELLLSSLIYSQKNGDHPIRLAIKKLQR